MISFVEPLAAGNAVRLHLAPPPGATSWRVLRRAMDGFTGFDDPGAVRVGDLRDPHPTAVLDVVGLVNGVEYVYQEYVRIQGEWHEGSQVRATPRATYEGDAPDVLAVVRERIALGLATEVKREALKPASKHIPVLTALYPLPDEKKLPAVSIHVDSDMPAHRFLGEVLQGDIPGGLGSDFDEPDLDDEIGEYRRLSLNIVGISLNGDERAALRRALGRIVRANMPVWDEIGMLQVDFSQRDQEQPGENNAVVYVTVGTLSCLAPSRVVWTLGAIADVTVTAFIPGQEDPETHD